MRICRNASSMGCREGTPPGIQRTSLLIDGATPHRTRFLQALHGPPPTAVWPPPDSCTADRQAGSSQAIRDTRALHASGVFLPGWEGGSGGGGARGGGGAGRAPQQPRGTMYTNSEFIGSMPAIELDDGDDGLTGHLQPGAMHSSHGVADRAKVRCRALSPCGHRVGDEACIPAASSGGSGREGAGQKDLCCPSSACLRALRHTAASASR